MCFLLIVLESIQSKMGIQAIWRLLVHSGYNSRSKTNTLALHNKCMLILRIFIMLTLDPPKNFKRTLNS